MKEIMTSVEDAVKTIAMILLVVAGGGVLKQILIDSGLGTYIGSLIHGSDMSPLLMAWLIAAVIRTSVGSATVAALTAGGIVAPLIPLTGVSPELMVLAVGAGSVIFSPPNDPGFWLFKEFFGLTIKGTIRHMVCFRNYYFCCRYYWCNDFKCNLILIVFEDFMQINYK